MPVYNTAQYLREAVDSLLGQTFRDFELIAVNDGSSDGCAQILDNYAARDSRVKVVHQVNHGVSFSFNRGMQLADGTYIARMDSDDVSVPDRLERQVNFLDLNPGVVGVSGWVVVVDEWNDPISIQKPPESHASIDAVLMARERSPGGGAFFNSCSMARATALHRVGGCRVEFEPTDDRDLWLRMSELGPLYNLQHVLLKYRLNIQGISQSRLKEQRMHSKRAVLDAYRRRGLPRPDKLVYPVIEPEPTRAELFRKRAKCAAAYGYYQTARGYGRRLVWEAPFSVDTFRILGRAYAGPFASSISKFLRRLSKSLDGS